MRPQSACMRPREALVLNRAAICAWFNISMLEGGKTWVAGVERAKASEPAVRKPRTWGRRPSGVDPSHP